MSFMWFKRISHASLLQSEGRQSMIVSGGMVMAHVPYYLYGRLVTNNVSVNDTWELFLGMLLYIPNPTPHPCPACVAKPKPKPQTKNVGPLHISLW